MKMRGICNGVSGNSALRKWEEIGKWDGDEGGKEEERGK